MLIQPPCVLLWLVAFLSCRELEEEEASLERVSSECRQGLLGAISDAAEGFKAFQGVQVSLACKRHMACCGRNNDASYRRAAPVFSETTPLKRSIPHLFFFASKEK